MTEEGSSPRERCHISAKTCEWLDLSRKLLSAPSGRNEGRLGLSGPLTGDKRPCVQSSIELMGKRAHKWIIHHAAAAGRTWFKSISTSSNRIHILLLS